MSKKVTVETGGEAGSQHRWSCLYCGTRGPWSHQTVAMVAGADHEDQHRDEAHGVQNRDEDLDEILQNLTVLPPDSTPPNDE
jgi:hypothetical protein